MPLVCSAALPARQPRGMIDASFIRIEQQAIAHPRANGRKILQTIHPLVWIPGERLVSGLQPHHMPAGCQQINKTVSVGRVQYRQECLFVTQCLRYRNEVHRKCESLMTFSAIRVNANHISPRSPDRCMARLYRGASST